jgi:hypothetical protein
LDEGFLRRCDGPEAVLSLVRVMANTPQGSWAGCPHFGLRDLLEQSSLRQEKVQLAMDQINRALQDLGITSFRVEAMNRDSAAAAEVGQWTITLASTAEPGRTFSAGLSGKAE